MRYTIETIPMVLLSKIMETNDFSLLSDENLKESELIDIYNTIRSDYIKYEDSPINKKVDELKRQIQKEENRYNIVYLALEALSLGKNELLIKSLQQYGYHFNGDFETDLELAKKQSVNILNKIERLKNEMKELLKVDDSDNVNIYESIVNISVGLEMPLNCNSLTAIEFIFYKKALKAKVKALTK